MQLKEGGGCHSYYARGHRHGLFALDKVYKDYPKMCAQKCRIKLALVAEWLELDCCVFRSKLCTPSLLEINFFSAFM